MAAETRASLHVTHPLLLSHFDQNWNLSSHFRKFPNAKLAENPFGVSLVFFYLDRQT
jgi:hypothetical protein